MEKNEIIKILKINKPSAYFQYIRKGSAYYKAHITDTEIIFIIPISDMGDADFLPEMEARFLVRWIN